MIAVLLTKRRLILPVLQISRRINLHLLSHCQNHDPALGALIPEDVGVAEIRLIRRNDRIAFIFYKCETIIF